MADITITLTSAQLTRTLDAFKLRTQSDLEDELLNHVTTRVVGEEENRVRDPAGDTAVVTVRTELTNEGWVL